MTRRPLPNDAIAVIGAGIIGCAIAQTLAARGRPVLLLDRAGPAIAGASFGNVGHIATEQVETLPVEAAPVGILARSCLPSAGALDIPLRRVMSLSPWLVRFARAAFRQESNTRHLAPLVRDAANSLERLLGDHRPARPHSAQWPLRGVARGRRLRAGGARSDQRRAIGRQDRPRTR